MRCQCAEMYKHRLYGVCSSLGRAAGDILAAGTSFDASDGARPRRHKRKHRVSPLKQRYMVCWGHLYSAANLVRVAVVTPPSPSMQLAPTSAV